MPGLSGRMSTVIKAKISKLLDRAEDPGETLDYSGRIEEAAEIAGIGFEKVRDQGLSSVLGLLSSDRATRLLRLGRWDEADAALLTGLDAVLAGVTGSATLSERALLDILRGQFDEASERLAEAARAQGHVVGSMWTGPMNPVPMTPARNWFTLLMEDIMTSCQTVVAKEYQKRRTMQLLRDRATHKKAGGSARTRALMNAW